MKSLSRCLRLCKRIALYEQMKSRKMAAVAQGWWDGVRGHMGPRPRGATANPQGSIEDRLTPCLATPRKALGRAKITCSCRPCNSSATSPPHSRSFAITPCTRISGAEAPAVSPILLIPANHSRLRSSGPSTRYPGLLFLSAISRRRLEFELDFEPTTTSTSQRPISSLTASWRFCVA